jgi:hypothetical protein
MIYVYALKKLLLLIQQSENYLGVKNSPGHKTLINVKDRYLDFESNLGMKTS